MAALAGSAVLGVVAGAVWAAVAPRAMLQEIARGEAELVNPETRAYIVGDAWFCLIMVVCGLIAGIVGYRFLIRRAGWLAAAGLVIGAVGGGWLALWVGENIGLGTYNHLLLSSASGTVFNGSLGLGAKSALAFWPMFTSIVILMAGSGGRRTIPAVAGGSDPGDAPGMWPSGPAGGHSP